jgi:hypothetical protein
MPPQVSRAGTSAYQANLDNATASRDNNAYVGHYIRFTDGTCRGRYARITAYPNGTFTAELEDARVCTPPSFPFLSLSLLLPRPHTLRRPQYIATLCRLV